MNSIRPTAVPPSGYSLNTAMAHFEEEKTFFGAMFVVVTPYTRRRLKHLRTRREREREASTLGRVIRRFRSSGIIMRERKSPGYDGDTALDG